MRLHIRLLEVSRHRKEIICSPCTDFAVYGAENSRSYVQTDGVAMCLLRCKPTGSSEALRSKICATTMVRSELLWPSRLSQNHHNSMWSIARHLTISLHAINLTVWMQDTPRLDTVSRYFERDHEPLRILDISCYLAHATLLHFRNCNFQLLCGLSTPLSVLSQASQEPLRKGTLAESSIIPVLVRTDWERVSRQKHLQSHDLASLLKKSVQVPCLSIIS